MRLKSSIPLFCLALAFLWCTPAFSADIPDADAALNEAQELLGWAYDLTPATLSLFRCQVDETEDGTWQITYTGDMPYPEPLGDYAVTLYPDVPPDVSWTYDGVDPGVWQGGLLDAPVWGQAQLAKAYDAIVHRKPADIEPLRWGEIPLSSDDQDITVFADNDLILRFTRAEPGSEGLSEAEAEALARQAILDTYGVDAEALSPYTMSTAFATPAAGGPPEYIFWFERSVPRYQGFVCRIASPSGEVLHCAWNGPARLRPLPAGPLDTYAQAVTEFLSEGSLLYRNAEEKAGIVQLLYQAGYTEELPNGAVYAFPGPEDLSEEEALAAARAALERSYAFPAEAFPLFDVCTSLLAYPDNRLWVVDFPHALLEEAGLRSIAHALGTYQVTLSADTGEVLSTSWNLASLDTGITYTRETWGAIGNLSHDEAVIPPHVLPWVAELYCTLSAVSARYPAGTWAVEYAAKDAVAVDTTLRAAGFSRFQYGLAMPRTRDIPLGVAAFRARSVLLQELRLSRSVVDAAELDITYSVDSATGPAWHCSFHLADGELQAEYLIRVDAVTGEILSAECYTSNT